MEPAALLKRIDEYKAVIDTRRPLAKEELKQLDDYFRIGLGNYMASFNTSGCLIA